MSLGLRAKLEALLLLNPPSPESVPLFQDCPKCSVLGFGDIGYHRPEVTRGRRAGRFIFTPCCAFSAPLARQTYDTQDEVIAKWDAMLQ